jgi:hypothetical protein
MVSHIDVRHARADLQDLTCAFVSEHDGDVHRGRPRLVHVQVRMADASGSEANPDLVPPWPGEGQVLDAERHSRLNEHDGSRHGTSSQELDFIGGDRT